MFFKRRMEKNYFCSRSLTNKNKRSKCCPLSRRRLGTRTSSRRWLRGPSGSGDENDNYVTSWRSTLQSEFKECFPETNAAGKLQRRATLTMPRDNITPNCVLYDTRAAPWLSNRVNPLCRLFLSFLKLLDWRSQDDFTIIPLKLVAYPGGTPYSRVLPIVRYTGKLRPTGVLLWACSTHKGCEIYCLVC